MFARVLNDEQIVRIHEASLAILQRVGVVVPHPEVLDRFAAHGAQVDRESQRVRIPPKVVESCLAQAGKKFTLYGRDLSKKAEYGVGKRNYNSSGGQALWLDHVTGERRYPSLADVGTAARLGDALEHLNIVGAMADPHELPISYRCVEVMAELLRNTNKPLMMWFYNRDSAKFLVEMLIAVRGDEKRASEQPLCYPFLEPISPLRFPFHGIDMLFETTRVNLPVPVGPMAQLGLSAPATVAGTMAQENAEVLAGICVVQMVKPGVPVCHGGICHAFDMRTTQMIFSGPEQAIFGVGMTQMGKYYGLPVYINVGLTDSKLADAQAGLESGITLSLGAAAGADVFGHMGICGDDQGGSLDILVMQHEIISYVNSVMRDIEVSDDTLAIDEVEAVALGSGGFIDREHTAQHFRKELWFPRLLDREFYQGWQAKGATSMQDRCRRRVEDILRTHKPEPLAPELAKELDKIVAAARRELGG